MAKVAVGGVAGMMACEQLTTAVDARAAVNGAPARPTMAGQGRPAASMRGEARAASHHSHSPGEWGQAQADTILLKPRQLAQGVDQGWRGRRRLAG